MLLSLSQAADRCMPFHSSHNAASSTIVETSPARARAAHKRGCVCLPGDTPCESVRQTRAGALIHIRGSSAAAVVGQQGGADWPHGRFAFHRLPK